MKSTDGGLRLLDSAVFPNTNTAVGGKFKCSSESGKFNFSFVRGWLCLLKVTTGVAAKRKINLALLFPRRQ